MVEAITVIALVLAGLCTLALVALGVFVSQLKSRFDMLLDERGAIKKSALPPDVAAGPKPSAPQTAGPAARFEKMVEELTEKLTAAQETVQRSDTALHALAARVLALEQQPQKPIPAREPAALPSSSIPGSGKQQPKLSQQQSGAPAPPPQDAGIRDVPVRYILRQQLLTGFPFRGVLIPLGFRVYG
jgi:uncharacterized coiled-coil protein SlyX